MSEETDHEGKTNDEKEQKDREVGGGKGDCL